MTKNKQSFSKKEKVKSKKEVSRIFSDGIFFYSDLLSVGVAESNDKNQMCHKFAASVPKKLFKSAVKRNKIKRLIRESLRLNKQIFSENVKQKKTFYNLMFIYKSRKITTFHTVQKGVILLLKKISEY
ncbi:MAG: ribonuclease P protein component [Bacteroidales bacterium]|nr:ribonuclease P protein component [Bacteroidales bacterium]